MIWQIEKKKSMLNPYQQLLWIWIGNQFYFYVFSFKIRKRNIGSMDSGLSYICYSKKKPEWHILCRNISKYHHFVTSGSQDTKKSGCCCCVVEERMMPCFFWLGSPLSFRPIIETLDRKKDSLSSHLIKKFLKVEGGDTAQHVPTCLVKPFWLGIDSDQSFIGSQRKLATPIAFFNEWHHQQCVHYRTAVRSSFKKFMDCFLVCQKPWKFNTSAEKDFLCILTL